MEVLGEDRREGLGRKVTPRVSLLMMLLVSTILLLSSLYSAEASVFRKAREGVLDVTQPFLSTFAAPINFLNSVFGSVGDYFNVVDENRILRQENAQLRQWMEEALALRELVSVFEKLQTYETPPEIIPIDAHVISDSNDVFAKSMIVNAGQSKKVRVGMAVVNEAGLIGRIIEAGGNASRVLLLTDIQSRIPVYVEGANIEGILVGRTGERPVIRFTNQVFTKTLERGARVLTSGSGGVMPSNIPIGTLYDVTQEEISINLFVDYTKTRLVRVLDYDFPEVVPVEITSSEEEAVQTPPEDPAGENASSQGGEQIIAPTPQTGTTPVNEGAR